MENDHYIRKRHPFNVGGEIWFEKNGTVFITPLTVDLMELIGMSGSINQAAKALQISYQKAWNLIDLANRNARLPLITRTRGGATGGGANVTAEGERIIKKFRLLENQFEKFVENSVSLFDC